MSTEFTPPQSGPNETAVPSAGSKRLLFAVLFFLLVGYPFLKYGFVETWGYVGDDFDVFCLAAERMRGGASPYPPEVLEGGEATAKEAIYGEYIYPALFARLMTPFTYLPRYPAKLLYLSLSLAAYLWLVFPWEALREGARLRAYTSIAVLLGWAPVIQNVRFGQSNLLPLLLFAAGWRIARHIPKRASSAERSRPEWLAGFLFGLGATVKLTPLLLLPVLIVARKGRLCWGVLLGLGCGLLASGPGHTYVYFTKVFPLVTQLPDMPNSYGLSTFLDQATHALVGAPAGGWICAVLYVGTVGYIWRKKSEMTPENYILLGCWIPALFAGLWLHHYVVAVLPLSIVLSHLTEKLELAFMRGKTRDRSKILLQALAIAILLLPGFNYWYPVKELIDAALRTTGFHHAVLFVPGFALASFILIPSLLADRSKDA